MIYKGFKIKKSKISTTVFKPMPFGKLGHYEKIVYLYEVVNLKRPGCTPLLTTISECKAYIKEHKK